MPVNIDATARKYHGAMAATYETKRKKQERWDIENATVEAMLTALKPKSILDVPCGTGRFIALYDKLGVKDVTAVDVSDTMLEQAQAKMKKVKSKMYVDFICKDVRNIKHLDVDVSVCVRFLDLIDEEAMRSVMKKLFACTDKAIICTIRLGNTYIPKSNTATHHKMEFNRMIRKAGWTVADHVDVFNQGWVILQLVPR